MIDDATKIYIQGIMIIRNLISFCIIAPKKRRYATNTEEINILSIFLLLNAIIKPMNDSK